jgi:hypothetical protein
VLGEGKFVKQKKVPFFIQGEAKIWFCGRIGNKK